MTDKKLSAGEVERYADGQVNIDRTLFNEIRISEPVNEDGEPTKYLISEAQLQRVAELEFAALSQQPECGKAQSPDAGALVEALEDARLFIRNGIELGYIRMPDADTPDPAHDTLPKIDALITAYRAQGKGAEG